MYRLTPPEREVIITCSPRSGVVTIYCTSKPWIRKCVKAGFKEVSRDSYSTTFVTSMKNIIFRSSTPRKRSKRVLSEEHKRKMQEARK